MIRKPLHNYVTIAENVCFHRKQGKSACDYKNKCMCVCVGAAPNRASTYLHFSEMEKIFPWGQQAAVTSHEGRQEGGTTTRGMGKRQHSGQRTKQGGLGFVRGECFLQSASWQKHCTVALWRKGGVKRKGERVIKKEWALKSVGSGIVERKKNNIFATGRQWEEWGQNNVGLLHKAGIRHRSAHQTKTIGGEEFRRND